MAAAPVPKSIKMFGITVKLEAVAELDGGENVGEFDETTNTVRYVQGQDFYSERDTVLHELVHLIEKRLLLKMREKQVMMLTGGLLELLRNNPPLVRYLCSKEPENKNDNVIPVDKA